MRQSKRYLKRRPSAQFGAYLRELRENRTSFNLSEAARQLGLKRQGLFNYEKGDRAPPDSLLVNLAHLYRVPTAEVLERAYWPQLVLLPLIAIIDPEQLPRDFIEELEKGLEEEERREITRHIEELLRRRATANRS